MSTEPAGFERASIADPGIRPPDIEARTTPVSTPRGFALPGNRFDLLDGQAPAQPPLVSVVVVHYEQHVELERTLLALARQTYPADRIDIVVVDDGSRVAPTVPAHVRLVAQPDRGFRVSAARNAGAAVAAGEILCFLDADTTPEPAYIAELTRLPALAPDALTVARRRHADLGGVPTASPIETAAPPHELPEPQWLIDAYAASDDLLHSDDRSYRFLIGAVLACHRVLFDATGGFDESFSEYGGEDWEWAYRAWLQGAVFAHVSTAVAWHDGPEWAARSLSEAQLRKNVETLTLMSGIAVDGSTPRALLTGRPDVVVRIHSAPSEAALIICVDSVLEGLPRARVLYPARFERIARLFADPRIAPLATGDGGGQLGQARVVVDLPRAVRVAGCDLRAQVESLVQQQLGTLTLVDGGHAPIATITALRAERRARRWGVGDLFASATATIDASALDEEPSLAAHFGRW